MVGVTSPGGDAVRRRPRGLAAGGGLCRVKVPSAGAAGGGLGALLGGVPAVLEGVGDALGHGGGDVAVDAAHAW